MIISCPSHSSLSSLSNSQNPICEMVALIPHSSVRSFDGGKNADDDNSCHLKGKDSVTNVVVHFNSMHYFSFTRGPSGREIKNRLSIEESIPADMIIIQINGRLVGDQEILVDIDGVAPAAAIVVRATIANGLAGGKGGFGAMLRALAKQSGTKKTTDFGACRDLSGRRLRHVNDEMILQKWKEAKDKGEDFDVEEETPAGIEMWYLGTPSWADGIKTNYKKKFMKPRRKTKICMDWVRARSDRKAPEGAPAHWGCPRGRRCEFAHGDEELRGEAADLKDEEKSKGTTTEANRKRDAYVASIARQEEEDQLSDMILQGMRAQKKARIGKGDTDTKKNVAEMTLPILPMDGLDFPDDDKIALEPQANISNVTNKEGIPVEKSSVYKTAPQDSMKVPKTVLSTCKWMRSLSGQLILNNEGEIEGESEFGTAAVCCKISEGKWYYEVELLTAGLMQIGWANHLFLTAGENSEDGVGDDIHSWAYDGLRGKKWNKDDADYGHISGKDISNSNSSGASSISGSSSSSSSGSGSKISSLASGRNSLPSCTVESATAGTESSEVEPGNLNMRTSQSWSVGDVLGCLLEISGKTESLASGETEMLACISFTLNGVSLGVAFSDISFLSLKANSDKIISDSTCSSSSSGGGDTGGCLDKNVDMPGYFYPSLSLEDGEAVLLNIGQRPFSFPPSSDINVISSISLPDAASSDLVIEVIEEKIVKKKAATAKKGKKTKKEIAAEKEAEIEDARVSKELADTTAAAITERERKLIDLIVAPSAPYLPVLQALESEIRALVPLELTVSTDTGGKEKIEVLASLISEKKSSSSVAKKVNDGNDSHNSNQKNASLTLISDVQVESASALVVPVVLADPISYAPVLLESEEYSSSSLENLKILGLQHLKAELERRGLKAGGSLEERASRLFSVRGLKPSEINKKLKAKC